MSDEARVVVAGLLALVGVLTFLAEMPGATADDSSASSRQVADVNEPRGSDTRQPERQKVDPVRQRAEEQRNKPKIKSLLADMKTLRTRDYEARLAFWDDIVSLAPANEEFARKRQQMADKVASLASLREHPELGASVEKVRGRKAGFGNVLVIDITLRNDALSDLKDFVIACASKGPSGTVIDVNTRTLYEVVPSRGTHTFRSVNMGLLHGQAVSMNCTVEEASIA